MTRNVFDISRLRHNWDRAASRGVAASAEERHEPARDDEPELVATQEFVRGERESIARTWEHVQALIVADYAGQAEALAPFVSELNRLIGLMSEPNGNRDDPATREALRGALADLEDLLEVYGGYGL